MAEKRINFGSKIGAVLAAAGSAVGLGNVWRFPTETGNNGGAAFLIIYVAFMLLLGVPVMIAELTIGRYGQKSVPHAFYTMSGGKKVWRLMGLIPLLSGTLILSYYAVVAGWTLEYAWQAGLNGFAGKTPADFTADFNNFVSNPLQPVIWMGIILVLTCSIVATGVQKGIERAARLMMPVLFVFILILVGCSLSLPGADKGLDFLFSPDFSKVTPHTILSAMAQAFFSLSVGILCLCTYACYFRKDVNLVRDGLSVAGIDTMVAVLSGMIIFPAVYSVEGLQPDAGPALVFITLPNVFQQVFHGAPVLTYFFSLMFYLLLVMAALTSSISMLEMTVSLFHEEKGTRRVPTSIAATAVCFVLGIACSLSFGAWSGFTIGGLGFFDLFDFIVAKLLMPVGALLSCLFLGWYVDGRILRDEISNGGEIHQSIFPLLLFCIKYLAPVCIVLIFLNELGLFEAFFK